MISNAANPLNSDANLPAGLRSGGGKGFDADRERPERERPGRVTPDDERAGGHGTGPVEDDLSKEELKAKLQRKRWRSRLRGLIWLFLIAMNLYLVYLIFSVMT